MGQKDDVILSGSPFFFSSSSSASSLRYKKLPLDCYQYSDDELATVSSFAGPATGCHGGVGPASYGDMDD